MQYKLEICANSIESALAAQRGGTDRIELCDNMQEGGTTPSFGMIRRCKELLSIPVFPIIRPRGGDFVYTDEEFEVMKVDVEMCKELGCEGVVIGILKEDGSIDKERCAVLIAMARPMEVTFHRAFDCCKDMKKGLEDIIDLGCQRVLTSGGAALAADGIAVIRDLVKQAEGRVIIMAGSGINGENLQKVADGTEAGEFHSTAKKVVRRYGLDEKKEVIDASFYETDENLVDLLNKILKKSQFY